MAQAARTFRIFVSSTFDDLKEERNALQEQVFPALKELCLTHKARFQAIDLRWGVSEEASLDQQTINICLTEIERCRDTSPRPNFIVLLGDRYGWRPPPPQIPADEFQRILSPVSDPEEQKLLEEWYPRDDNAVLDRDEDRSRAEEPGWQLRHDVAVLPEHCLRPREKGGPYDEYEEWAPVERRLQAILHAAVEGTDLDDDPKYTASATQQEVVRGALTYPDAQEHVFCFFRRITDLPEDVSAKSFRDFDAEGNPDADAQKRLAAVKERLRDLLPRTHVHDYEAGWTRGAPSTGHLDEFCADVKADLERVIREELKGLEAEEELDKEIADHAEFGRERADHFIGRRSLLERIGGYIGEPDPHPLAIHGASGSGKSALIARAAEEAGESHPEAEIVVRFIGATPQSSDGRDLLRNLCRQITRRYRETGAAAPEGEVELLDERTVPTDYRELVEDLPKRLALASAERRLVIFLDALDQLSDADGARSLAWLPAELPEHVRIVVSVLQREPEQGEQGPPGLALGDPLVALKAKLPADYLVELEPMSRDDGDELLDAWLADADRTLTDDQRAEVLAKFEPEGLPLYLKLAFEEARRWHSYTPANKTELSEEGIPGIIRENLFARLAVPENHGQVLTARSLAYLAAAKNGLSEDELLDVLSDQDEVLADFKKRAPRSPPVDRLPVVVWSRLYFDLAPYLSDRRADDALLMSFYHRQLREVIEEDYLPGRAAHDLEREEPDRGLEGRDRHRELARYFADDEDQPLERQADGEATANLRRLSELPYQQTYGETLWNDVFKTLTDFHFLEVKAANSGVVVTEDAEGNETRTYTGAYLLQDDYSLALEQMPGNGAGARAGRRRIIVTGTDLGDGLKLRCPHCNRASDFKDRWKGKDIDCPECGGPLKVNEFVVEQRG